ncbi:hypothetical protein A9Q81_06665 [Gammaproteobacteria bacterium 42_54_T18]|nr:hypothetical protein A9Q81_06665 [Gammaproteobacteria bacterium 42_54_T18]
MKTALNKKKGLITMAVVLIGCLLATTAHSSGSFVPSERGPGNARYNNGKALFLGRKGDANCSECHKKFKRSKLLILKAKISQRITDCTTHTPCFDAALDDKQLRALDAYFFKRYRLK